jgi:H+/Cl- antiporter ClcA
VAGAAAGLASAFNTPLGGIVYAIEELGAVHFHRIRTALLSAVIVAGLVSQWALGSYLYLGFPPLQNINFGYLPMALLIGAVAGAAGGLFGHLLYRLNGARARIKDLRWQISLTVACGVVIAVFIHLNRYAVGTGIEMTMGFLFHGERADIWTVLIRFFATIIAYLSGAAGGIFSPALAAGAAIGSYLGDLVGTHHRNLTILLGMIGFLTGVTRTPFTSFILVLEMTDHHSAIFPMMMSALVAQGVAHRIDPLGVYEHLKERWLMRPAGAATPSQAAAAGPSST